MQKPRRLATPLLCLPAILLSGAAGCRSDAPARVAPEQAAARLTSTVYTADPNSEAQLLSGFYRIEDYSWRWTAQRFSVVLRPPEGATGEGAKLVARLTVPDVVIHKLHSITLSATIGDSRLGPETYSGPGDYTYTRGVAPNLLTSEEVRVDFELDNVMPPVGEDKRPLGIVVTSIGLEPE